MGYIYKITNTINNKVYIGMTKGRVIDRWGEHKTSSKFLNYPIYVAMRKYGLENFVYETIEECDELNLQEREIFWISYYNSYLGAGYNCTKGGDGRSGTYLDYSKILFSFLKTGSIKQTIASTGHNVHTIIKAVKSETGKNPQEFIQWFRKNKTDKHFDLIISFLSMVEDGVV